MIETTIAHSADTVAGVEKAAGISRGELRSFLHGGDLQVSSLVAAGGLLGVSPVDMYEEEARG